MSTRYFKTTNALRPYFAGETRFEFEQVRLIGGLYHGVLKVDDGDFAEKVAKLGRPVSEINEAEYSEIKKKVPGSSYKFSNSSNQPKRPPVKKAAPAATAKSPEVEAEIDTEAATDPDELFNTGDLDEPIDHLESTPPVERVSKKDK